MLPAYTDLAGREPSGEAQAHGESLADERLQVLEHELARYVWLLCGCEGLHRVIVFGSLSTGDTHPWSDIDLLIVQDTDLPFLKRSRALRELLQPRVGTDLLVYTPAEFARLSAERPFVRQAILERGRVVYERHR
jgi:predicted nucleotidyltransferase